MPEVAVHVQGNGARNRHAELSSRVPLFAWREAIAELALEHRLPAIAAVEELRRRDVIH